MSVKLNSLLSSEDSARGIVEEATKEARRIRTGIPAGVSEIEKEYSSELQKYEEKGIEKVQEELSALNEKLKLSLESGKTALEERSKGIAPRALELIHSAIEGEKK
ncbi:MAG: hypothetical protein KAH54_05570 [Candidatus Sabulitectum sp.]|nr:hypothetical protein [Candidatus Sabulitectum sp.]